MRNSLVLVLALVTSGSIASAAPTTAGSAKTAPSYKAQLLSTTSMTKRTTTSLVAKEPAAPLNRRERRAAAALARKQQASTKSESTPVIALAAHEPAKAPGTALMVIKQPEKEAAPAPLTSHEKFEARKAEVLARVAEKQTATQAEAAKGPTLALPAPKPMLALPAPEKAPEAAETVALAPVSNAKPSLMARAGSAIGKLHPITWMKNNLTVSTEASDHMVAAKALRKEGRLGEAADSLTAAPAPRGFVERLLLGHAERKVRSASMTEMKDAAKKGHIAEAQAAHEALEKLAPTMGRFSAWRAERAVAKSAKLSISAARTAGKHGDLDSAHDSVMLASQLGASDRQLDKASARLQKDATKQATRSAKQGDIQATSVALEHAMNVPGSTMTEDEHQTILEKSVSTHMEQLVKQAKVAYKHNDKESAALAMAELKDLRSMSGVELSGGVHRDEVRMTALLGAQIDKALAEMNAPATDEAKAASKEEAANDNVLATATAKNP